MLPGRKGYCVRHLRAPRLDDDLCDAKDGERDEAEALDTGATAT